MWPHRGLAGCSDGRRYEAHRVPQRPDALMRQEQPIIGSRLMVAIFAFLAFIVVSNNTAASIAQPAIGHAFGAGPADVGWVVFGFGATFAVGTAVWGGLARRRGIRPSLATGV